MDRRRIVPAVFLVLLLIFIWGQSLLPRSASNAQSSFLALRIAEWLGRDPSYVNRIVRKCAHLIEFAALGFVLTRLFGQRKWYLPICVAVGFSVAFLDETIQIFSGRGSAIADVWLDLCGVVLGTAVGALLRLLGRRKNAP